MRWQDAPAVEPDGNWWEAAPLVDEPTLGDKVRAIPGQIAEAVTGAQRRTAEIETLPDWAGMPEMNSFSMSSFKTALGTMLAGPEEVAKVLQANYPGVQIRQDEKGNLVFRSSIDGQEYGYRPGFRVSDIPRAVGGVLAFTPAGRVTTIPRAGGAAAATQAAIEGSQAATGGDFDPLAVGVAGGVGAAVPAVVSAARAAANPVRQALGRAKPDPAAAAITQAASPQDVTQAAKAAGQGGIGSARATRVLAEQASPDQATTEAAERLGIANYLQPDHVTTSEAYRQVVAAIKSNPQSRVALAEREGLAQVSKRAADLIEEIGGTSDLSGLSAGVKAGMQDTVSQLKGRADVLYDKVRSAIKPTTQVETPATLAHLRQRMDELGGAQNLAKEERMVFAKLAPGGNPKTTYALLDDVRRDIVAAKFARKGPFKDADDRLLDGLHSALREDQGAAARAFGVGDEWALAQQTASSYKAVQDDLTSLFGKSLDGNFVGGGSTGLPGAFGALSKGDSSRLVRLLGAVPQEMRQEVVASGLSTVFRNAATRGEISFTGFSKWWEGLARNEQAKAALFAHLSPQARQQLSDLYKVSKGISDSLNARTKTGALNTIKAEMMGADSLMESLYASAKRAGAGAAAEAVTTPMGIPGAGVAAGIASALTKGKTKALQSVDDLIASPEFAELARTSAAGKDTAKAVRRFANTRRFSTFVKQVGSPREMDSRERWVLQALQARNNQDRSQ